MRPYKRPSRSLAARLGKTILARRKETVYRILFKRHAGHVPCYVCGEHVQRKQATVEHIRPKSKGGTDEVSNLSISHGPCNQARGNDYCPQEDKTQ